MKNFNNKLLFFIFLTSLSVAFLFFDSSHVFASTDITEDITTNTTWNITGSPYIVKNNIEVALGTTLTIDPGVVVKFDPTAHVSITVFGDLVANGEADNKIYFTSNYDDTLGGNTNDDNFCYEDFDIDGNSLGQVCESLGLMPSKNDWQGIYFIDSHNNYLKNVVFKYADEVAYLDHTYLNLKNVELSNGNYGIMTNVSNIDAEGLSCINIGTCIEEYNLSSVNLKNLFADLGGYAVDLYNSNLNGENLEINNSYSGVLAYLGSNVSINNLKLNSIEKDALTVYSHGTVSVSDASFENIYDDAINIYDSNITADNLDMRNVTGDNDIAVYGNSHVAVKNSNFKNCPNNSCVVFYGPYDPLSSPANLTVTNSTFDGGVGSVLLFYNKIEASLTQNVMKNFPSSNILVGNYLNSAIDAEDNFWGSDTGPFHPDQNPTGTAGIVSDYVDFVPFCHTDKCKPRNPVILIPGIMGTEIFKNYDDNSEIWPNVNKLIFSITDNFLNDLALNPDGTENPDKPMKLGDIIRGTHVDILGMKYDSKTFEGLISLLESNGYVENTNLFVFPYDWRKSNADSAEKLRDKINKILADTGADKVDLVAHSMGGLVAKKYIALNGAGNVDQLIFIGTPQLGAPKAFKVIMEGDDMGVGYSLNSLNLKLHFLNPDKAKYIVQNMPGVFELLPSKKYIDGQSDFSGEKYITDYITPSFSDPNNPVKPDLSFGQTEDFLKSQKINTKMLDFADNLHNDTDNLDLFGVKVSNFIGCGTTKTIGRITVKKKTSGILFWKKLVNSYDLEYENGDDTVPLRSADDSSGDKYYVKGSSHGELPSAFGIEESVTALLRGKRLTDFPNVSPNKHDCYIKGKTISLRSLEPYMEYLVYDDLGNYTGPVKSIYLSKVEDPAEKADAGSEIEYGIPGVQYNKIGGTTSIFLPAGGSYRIVVKNIPASGGGGGGNGGGGNIINAYDFHIENVNADDTVASTTNFNNVPVDNSNENFQVQIPANTFPGETNANVPPVIQVDEDGDGTYENEIPPSVILDETQTNDVVAPSTTSSVAGNTVTLSASDNNSGVSNIQYSLDGGNTWTNYIAPIEVNVVAGGGDVVIQYFSTDNAGNIEPIQIITISAPPLPAPIIANIPPIHNSGGGIFILSEGKRTDFKGVQGLSLGNSDILENQITKEFKEPILNNLNISDFKRTVLKEVQEPSLNNLGVNSKVQSLAKESQTATPINSGFDFKGIWIFIGAIILIVGIYVARRFRKK